MDLHVGDIITGNGSTIYSITNEKSVCCILSVDSETMVVIVIGHEHPDYIGYGYTVKKSVFKKIEYKLTDYQKWLINEYGTWMYDDDNKFNNLICSNFTAMRTYALKARRKIKFDIPKTFLGYKVYKGKMIL